MPRTHTIGALLVAVLATAACGNDSTGRPDAEDGSDMADGEGADPDAGDADGGDGGDADAEGDAGDAEDGAPEETYCRSCRWDDECAPGDLCATLEGIEMACAPPCTVPEDCPSGAECVTRSGGTYCLPVLGGPDDPRTCVISSLGSACRAWGCVGRHDTCSDPAGTEEGFCTRTCRGDLDCDPGYNRCADRGDGVLVCFPVLPPPAERCGADPPSAGVGASCSGGASCTGDADTCLSSVDARLPDLCSAACEDPWDCAFGTRCLPVAGTSPADLEKYCVPDDCGCLERVPGSMLDDALDALGLDRCDLHFSSESMDYFSPELAHDRFRLPWYDDVHGEWLRGEDFVRATVGVLDDAATPRGLLLQAAAKQGHPVADRPFTPTLEPDDPLTGAIVALVEHHGGTADRGGIARETAGVPADLRRALAAVVAALDEAATARDEAIARIGATPALPRTYFNGVSSIALAELTGFAVSQRQVQDFLIGDFDYERVFQAAADVLRAVEDADLDRFRGTAGFSAVVDTPLGRIAIRDAADTEHGSADYPGDILLVVDTGGGDTYRVQAGATASVDNPVSLLIDLGGSDLYAYDEVPTPSDVPPRLPSDASGRYGGDAYYGPFSLSARGRQGSGTLGIGIALDLGAEGDEYRSLRKSQGWGALGVGILYDAGGDDTYLCEAGCQGASAFGVGILLDAGPGTDRYEGYNSVQGFAYVKAVGILYDSGGDDTYLAQPDDVLYYNPQDPGRSNSSMSQGMGFGRRSDPPPYGTGDGVFMSGGLGVLRDLGGDDDYECAIFCEGSGYWFGTGILADGAGNDHYDARWYVQGGSAHYAIAALWDAGGNDVYNETARRLNVTLGGGHDFSTAFLLDDAGDDVYGAPNLSMGAGNEDGFGLMVDGGGVDSYECSSDFSLGNASVDPASGARTVFPTMGLFLDAGGADTYERPTTTMVGDDALWTQSIHPSMTREHGAGVDRTAGVTGL